MTSNQSDLTLLEGKVNTISSKISQFSDFIGKMETAYADYILCVIEEKKLLSYKKLTDLMNQCYSIITEITNLLKEIKPITSNNGNIENKIKNNMYNMLLHKFQKSFIKFQELQNKYKDKEKEHLRREVKIKFPSLTDDEITQIITDGLNS